MVDEAKKRDPFEPKDEGGMDRRTFVKTALAAAAVGAAGSATAGLVVPLSTSGGLKIKRFPYFGARKVAGPAPQGIPLIPLRINDAGFVEGIPTVDVLPGDDEKWKGLETQRVGSRPPKDQPDTRPTIINFLEWYKYCGHDESPAFIPGFTEDNVLRYFTNPGKVKTAQQELGQALWYADKLGQPVAATDFRNVGDGAPVRWRSEELEGNDIVTGIIVRVNPDEVGGKDAEAFMAPSNPDQPDVKDLIAFCSYCAHFCCVPGYKESKIPREKGLFDKIYCTCHDSVYDPSDIRQYTFPPNL